MKQIDGKYEFTNIYEQEVMEAAIAWQRPSLLENSCVFGQKSIEKGIQDQRETTTLATVYYDDEHIPPTPLEPDSVSFNMGWVRTKVIPLNDSNTTIRQPIPALFPPSSTTPFMSNFPAASLMPHSAAKSSPSPFGLGNDIFSVLSQLTNLPK